MMTNVGVIDRALRLLIGLAILAWPGEYYGPPPEGLAYWAVAAIGGYPTITGLLRYDPIFALAGISTCAEEL